MTTSRNKVANLKLAGGIAAPFVIFAIIATFGGGESPPIGDGAKTVMRYIELLRANKPDEAIALWSAEQRATTTPRKVTDHFGPVLREHDFVLFTHSLSAEDRACHAGGIGRDKTILDDVTHSLRFFLVREKGQWRIETLQLYQDQAPEPPWPKTWHSALSRPSLCGSGYR